MILINNLNHNQILLFLKVVKFLRVYNNHFNALIMTTIDQV